MKYRPWIGFSLLGVSVVVDVMFGRSGAIFAITLVSMMVWATDGC